MNGHLHFLEPTKMITAGGSHLANNGADWKGPLVRGWTLNEGGETSVRTIKSNDSVHPTHGKGSDSQLGATLRDKARSLGQSEVSLTMTSPQTTE